MNIAKLNTASLDDKTFIIKRGTRTLREQIALYPNGELAQIVGGMLQSFPRLTKEQFYALE